jgi:hypothetical protein
VKTATYQMIEARSSLDMNSGCRLWRGYIDPQGYGRLRVGNVSAYAHRVSGSTFHNASILSGTVVCHTCDTRACVRPDHLELGDNAENMRQMVSRGRTKNIVRLTRQLADQAVVAVLIGESKRAVAHQYGIRRTNLSRLIARRRAKMLRT